MADRLTREIPGAFQPNQYFNPMNPRTHYETTGPEIWRDTAGQITHFVAGVGTGGTISGVASYLKEQNPAIQVVGADPEGSIYTGPVGAPLQGRGHRRRLLARHLRSRHGRRVHHGDRPRRLRDGAARHARRRHPGRRLGRLGGLGGAGGRSGSTIPTRWSSCCCPTAGAAISPSSTTTTGCARTASCRASRRRRAPSR